MFDFDLFANMLHKIYSEYGPFDYTEKDAGSVFAYFFRTFEKFTGSPHPPIKAAQIEHICRIMPYLKFDGRRGFVDIEPECYPALIDKYFQVEFPHCDRHIGHFFSGRIRELRFFEELY